MATNFRVKNGRNRPTHLHSSPWSGISPFRFQQVHLRWSDYMCYKFGELRLSNSGVWEEQRRTPRRRSAFWLRGATARPCRISTEFFWAITDHFDQWSLITDHFVFSVGSCNGVDIAWGHGGICRLTFRQYGVIFIVDAFNWFTFTGLGSFGCGFGLGLWFVLRLELTLRIAWSLSNNWASCLQKSKLIDWLMCRLRLCCHRRFECWLRSWIIAWRLNVCVMDYEPNCTIRVLHVMNNPTEA